MTTADHSHILSLDQVRPEDLAEVGGKAASLAELARIGLPVPRAACVTCSAYRRYLLETGLGDGIGLLLGRKEFMQMRWEELWDLSLRIRSLFLKTPLPPRLRKELTGALREYCRGPVVVRSSAPGEDSAFLSFAGLHESFFNRRGTASVMAAIRLVWASLWSDRALLYRRELGLDLAGSAMAVVVQEMIFGECSGIAFGRSPDNRDQSMIEAVWGLNQGLVEGTVAPDRWRIERSDGRIVRHEAPLRREALAPGRRGGRARRLPARRAFVPPLDEAGIRSVLHMLQAAEQHFDSPQDVEWTMAAGRLYLLQSRPITTLPDDERRWNLTLHRSFANLTRLRVTIEESLLPAMDAEARRLREVDLQALDSSALAAEIARRREILAMWEQRYREYCIPMAHGIRMFGQTYNDHLAPDNPFEFLELLATDELLALDRNRRLQEMAQEHRLNHDLAMALQRGSLPEQSSLSALMRSFNDAYGDLSSMVGGDLSSLAGLLLALAGRPVARATALHGGSEELLARYRQSLSAPEREFGEELLELARASYRLRDNDNLYLGRIQASLQQALDEAILRGGWDVAPEGDRPPVSRTGRRMTPPSVSGDSGRSLPGALRQARQIVGQPAVSGLGHGRARVITRAKELLDFRDGEILVCDAVDPNMTFVVPLAAAIVERRGGMLIHGAIIAREYGIPCVTGVPEATRLIATGNLVTVDGYLGLVIIDREERCAGCADRFPRRK